MQMVWEFCSSLKLGHMWLNLASLNGSLEAVEARNKLQVLMPPEAIVEAQAMAVNCIKTNYAACGLPTKPIVQSERIEKAGCKYKSNTFGFPGATSFEAATNPICT
jgi:hypothetical protein